jgi:hypothetical protein
VRSRTKVQRKKDNDEPLNEIPRLSPLNRIRRRQPTVREHLGEKLSEDEGLGDSFDGGVVVFADLETGDLRRMGGSAEGRKGRRTRRDERKGKKEGEGGGGAGKDGKQRKKKSDDAPSKQG